MLFLCEMLIIINISCLLWLKLLPIQFFLKHDTIYFSKTFCHLTVYVCVDICVCVCVYVDFFVCRYFGHVRNWDSDFTHFRKYFCHWVIFQAHNIVYFIVYLYVLYIFLIFNYGFICGIQLFDLVHFQYNATFKVIWGQVYSLLSPLSISLGLRMKSLICLELIFVWILFLFFNVYLSRLTSTISWRFCLFLQ